MYDLLPFPNIVGATIEEQTAQINNYLIQLKETLEFVLTDISVENLSQELVSKLNDLGADIEKSTEEQEDQLNQIANKTLTVSDVINSSAFETALDDATPKKYLVSVEQTQSSEEPEGVNIYAFEDGNGEVKQLTIKNGKDGKDGKDGANGIDGEDGQNGITPTFKIEEGELKVSYDDGETWTSLGYIYGENGVMGIDGDDGIDGVGITKTEINSNGELVITYSNNLISNLGVVVGAKGDKGDKGDKGEQGIQGERGLQGIQGEKGDKGDKGDTGAKGEKGDKGEQGVPGPQGAQGIQGIQGVQGEKGQDGKDGINGVDGVGIKTVTIDSGNLKITLTSGSTLNLGNIKGQDGKNGVDGKTPNVSFSVNFSTGNLEYTTS